jgi:acetyl esterase
MHALSLIERACASAFLRLPPRALRTIVGPALRSPEGHALDLQSQALLLLVRLRGEPVEHSGPVEDLRRRFDRACRILEPLADSPVRTRHVTIPGAAGARPVRIFKPASVRRGLCPALLWFHGGGFVVGSIEGHEGICRALASQAGVLVLAVDYRLAPEHPFPAGVDDARAVTQWVLDHGETFGVDPEAVVVGGDSAGGNFAAVVSQDLRGARRQPIAQLLVYPPTDARRGEPSHRHFARGFVLSEENIGWYLRQYIPDPSYVDHPRVSPLLARDLSALPHAIVVTAGFDPLRDEGRAYADRLRAAGVTVTELRAESALHGFIHTAGAIDESARLFAWIAERLRQVLLTRVRASAA